MVKLSRTQKMFLKKGDLICKFFKNGSCNKKDNKCSFVHLKDAQQNKKEDLICKFFKNGRCNKKDDECRFDHPRICRTFNQFGPKIGNNKGCDEDCNFFHPNTCRNSVKDRTRSYKECRFYHLDVLRPLFRKAPPLVV